MVGEYGFLLIILQAEYSKKKKVTVEFLINITIISHISTTDESQISTSRLNLLLEFYFIYKITNLISLVLSKSLSKLTCAKPNSWLHSPNFLFHCLPQLRSTATLHFQPLGPKNIGVILDFSFIPQIQFISNSFSHRVWIISKIWPLLTISCYYPGPRHYFLSNMVSLLTCLPYSHNLFHTERPEWIFKKESNHHLTV